MLRGYERKRLHTCAGVMKMVTLEVVGWFLGIFFHHIVTSVGVDYFVGESLDINRFMLDAVDDNLRLISFLRRV